MAEKAEHTGLEVIVRFPIDDAVKVIKFRKDGVVYNVKHSNMIPREIEGKRVGEFILICEDHNVICTLLYYSLEDRWELTNIESLD